MTSMIAETATRIAVSKLDIGNLKSKLLLIVSLCCALGVRAQVGQNRPYVDDKLIHFGFQLGMNFSTFHVTDSEEPIVNPITGGYLGVDLEDSFPVERIRMLENRKNAEDL